MRWGGRIIIFIIVSNEAAADVLGICICCAHSYGQHIHEYVCVCVLLAMYVCVRIQCTQFSQLL